MQGTRKANGLIDMMISQSMRTLIIAVTEPEYRKAEAKVQEVESAIQSAIKDVGQRVEIEFTESQRREIFGYLRREFPIHPLEAKLNTRAEVILEAIDRASDLTLRGIRGVIAEAAFKQNVVASLHGWRNETLEGDLSYDFLLKD